MGCDIHDYVEVRMYGRWNKVGRVFPNPYHDPEQPEQPQDEDGYIWNAKMIENPFRCRSYSTFAILADVRNGVGFAGCDTGDGFVPVSNPKGLPQDVSEEIKKASDAWGCDGHSHSWLTLRELEEYDWDRTSKRRGWVDPHNFDLWRKTGRPNGWSGSVEGGSIEHISNQMMVHLLDSGEIQFIEPAEGASPLGRRYTDSLQRSIAGRKFKKGSVGADIAAPAVKHYTLVEWEVSYRDAARDFLERTMPALRALGGSDDVRMVFWFDN